MNYMSLEQLIALNLTPTALIHGVTGSGKSVAVCQYLTYMGSLHGGSAYEIHYLSQNPVMYQNSSNLGISIDRDHLYAYANQFNHNTVYTDYDTFYNQYMNEEFSRLLEYLEGQLNYRRSVLVSDTKVYFAPIIVVLDELFSFDIDEKSIHKLLVLFKTSRATGMQFIIIMNGKRDSISSRVPVEVMCNLTLLGETRRDNSYSIEFYR